MNSLYQFSVKKTVEVEKTEETPDGKLVRKVSESVPIQIILKKPSRRENEEGETLYSVELSKCIRAGMLTEPLLVKYYANEGGIFTEEEQKEYSSLLLKFVEQQNNYQRASMQTDESAKEENVKVATEALIETQTRLQDFKRAQQSLFNQTAEKKASDKTIVWYVLQLTYIAEGEGDPVPFFKGKTLEEKLIEVDAAEEKNDEFFLRVWQRSLLFITFWYMGNAEKQEDFKFLEDSLEPKPKEEEPAS